MSASTVLPSAESVVGTGAPQVVPAQQAAVTAGRAIGLPRTVVEMAREQNWGCTHALACLASRRAALTVAAAATRVARTVNCV